MCYTRESDVSLAVSEQQQKSLRQKRKRMMITVDVCVGMYNLAKWYNRGHQHFVSIFKALFGAHWLAQMHQSTVTGAIVTD